MFKKYVCIVSTKNEFGQVGCADNMVNIQDEQKGAQNGAMRDTTDNGQKEVTVQFMLTYCSL